MILANINLGGHLVGRDSPVPERDSSAHVERLEDLASQSEHDHDEENEGMNIEQQNSETSKAIQRSDTQDLGRKFPMAMTIGKPMKCRSPPKRSRFAAYFPSENSNPSGIPANFFTSSLRKNSPAFLRGSPKSSPPSSPLARETSSLSESNGMVRPSVPPTSNSSMIKKGPGTDDTKFRAFLTRNDSAEPQFISPTGAHIFPGSFHSTRRPSATALSNNNRPRTSAACLGPSMATYPSENSSRGSRPMSSSRSARSANTRSNASFSSNTAASMWSNMDRNVDSAASQFTDHTRMTSASESHINHTPMTSTSTEHGSFAYPLVIPENQLILMPGHAMTSSSEMSNFNQASPEILWQPEDYFNQGMTLVPMTKMLHPPAPMVLDNMFSALAVTDPSPLKKKFRPTNMLLREQGIIPDNSRQDTNYEGDENHPDLLGLDNSVNCCMWILNIPKEVTPGEFMRILDCGAVAALSMVPPQKGHVTQAAKATFKKVAGGAELFRRARYKGGLRIRGQKIKVWYNDYGAYEWPGPETRFLEIEAPACFNEEIWLDYFGAYCKFTIISVVPLPCRKPGFLFTRFEFVRISGQAQTCLQAIREDVRFNGQVTVNYGIDPHDV